MKISAVVLIASLAYCASISQHDAAFTSTNSEITKIASELTMLIESDLAIENSMMAQVMKFVTSAVTTSTTKVTVSTSGQLKKAFENASKKDKTEIYLDADFTMENRAMVTARQNIMIHGQGHTITIPADTKFIVVEDKGALTVKNTMFTGLNSAVIVQGGAVFEDVHFWGFETYTYAGNSSFGAVAGIGKTTSNWASLMFTNCKFSDNSAGFAPAVIGMYAYISVTGSKFTGNSGISSIGAIMANGGELIVKDSQFMSNDGGIIGGAVYFYSAMGVIADSIFESNYASYGGAVVVATNSTVNVFSTKFKSNSALLGGVAYVLEYSTAVIYQPSAHGNTAALSSDYDISYVDSTSTVTLSSDAMCYFGYYYDSSSMWCMSCPAGYYGDSMTLTTSKCSGKCAAGYYSTGSAASCSACPNKTTSKAGASMCTK